MVFQDRQDAGKKLAEMLKVYKDSDAIVVALPRGGVVVGFTIANLLHLALDVLILRKLCSPYNPEYGIGAIAENGIIYISRKSIEELVLSNEQLKKIVTEEERELNRRKKLYRKHMQRLSFRGKTVILTDDGLATGVTVIAAIHSLRKQHPAKLILAIPGGPIEVIESMKYVVDELISLTEVRKFEAVGQLYRQFGQVSDETIIALLKQSRHHG